MANDADEAAAVAARIGYPVLVRPSLRARRPGDAHLLRRGRAARGPGGAELARRPLRRGRDRDRRRRGLRRLRRGRRRGDAARRGGRHPLRRLGLRDPAAVDRAGARGRAPPPDDAARARARGEGAGQRPVRAAARQVYVIEANPRASRTVPFVARPRACRWSTWPARWPPARASRSSTCASRRRRRSRSRRSCCRSSGSPAPTRCSARRCARPARSWRSRRTSPPRSRRPRGPPACRCRPARTGSRRAFLSVCDRDKSAATLLAQRLHDLGFELCATPGTARAIAQLGIPVDRWRRSPTATARRSST